MEINKCKENKTRVKSESEMSVVDLTGPEVKDENEDGKYEEDSEVDFPEDFFDDLANIEFVGGLNVIDTWEPETKDNQNIDETNTAAGEITKSESIKSELKPIKHEDTKVKNINPFNKEIAEAMGIKTEPKSVNDNCRLESPKNSRKRNHSRDRNVNNDVSISDYNNFTEDFIEVSSYKRRSNSRQRYSSNRYHERRTSKSSRRSKSPVSLTRSRMKFEPPKRKYKPSPPPYEDYSSNRRYRKSRSRRSRSHSSYSRSRDRSRRKYTSRRKRSIIFSPDSSNKHTHTRNSLSRFSISPRRNLTKPETSLRTSSILFENNSSESFTSNPPVPGLEFIPLNRIPGANPENPRGLSKNYSTNHQFYNQSGFNNVTSGIVHNMNTAVNSAMNSVMSNTAVMNSVMNSHMIPLTNNAVMNNSAVMNPHMNSVMNNSAVMNPHMNSVMSNSAVMMNPHMNHLSNTAVMNPVMNPMNNSAVMNNTPVMMNPMNHMNHNSAVMNPMNTVMNNTAVKNCLNNSSVMNNSAVLNNSTQSKVYNELDLYDPAIPLTSYNDNNQNTSYNENTSPNRTVRQRANEMRSGINGESVKKLFAEKKLSLSEFLTISAKNSVDSTISPKSVERKVKVLTSCQEAISRLEKLDLTFPDKFIYNENHNADFPRVIVPSSRFISPLRRTPLIKFKFTTMDHTIKGKSQRLRMLLNSLDIRLTSDESKSNSDLGKKSHELKSNSDLGKKSHELNSKLVVNSDLKSHELKLNSDLGIKSHELNSKLGKNITQINSINTNNTINSDANIVYSTNTNMNINKNLNTGSNNKNPVDLITSTQLGKNNTNSKPTINLNKNIKSESGNHNKYPVDSATSRCEKETSRKMTQTDLYECASCKLRNDLRVMDKSCQVDVQELASLSNEPLMGFKFNENGFSGTSMDVSTSRNQNRNENQFRNQNQFKNKKFNNSKRGKSRGGRGRSRKKAAMLKQQQIGGNL